MVINSMKRYNSLFENTFNLNIKFDTTNVGRKDWNNILFKTHKNQFYKKVIKTTCQEFLERSDYRRYSYDSNKVEDIKNSIISNNIILPIPILWFENEYSYKKELKSNWHDGQHRVLALKELEIKKILCMVVYEKI